MHVDSVHLQDGVAGGSHGGDHHALVEGAQEIAISPQTGRYLQQVAELDLAGHGERVDVSVDDALDEALERGDVLRQPPAV